MFSGGTWKVWRCCTLRLIRRDRVTPSPPQLDMGQTWGFASFKLRPAHCGAKVHQPALLSCGQLLMFRAARRMWTDPARGQPLALRLIRGSVSETTPLFRTIPDHSGPMFNLKRKTAEGGRARAVATVWNICFLCHHILDYWDGWT